MILITAAGGTVGGELAKRLASEGAPFRAAYHSEGKAAAARANGWQAAAVDFEKPETMRSALTGADGLFLVVPATPAMPAQEAAWVELAREAGVRRLVKLSVWRASEESFTFARWNRQGEKQVESAGIPYTFLRPNSFMQNFVNVFSAGIKEHGTFWIPAPAARVSHIDARDVAAAAAVALTRDGHEGRAYDLSGPEALNYHQVANTLSVVAGKKITCAGVSDLQFKEAMLRLGAPEWQPDAVNDLMRYALDGQAADVLASVQEITGRKPTPFERFVRDYRPFFA
ncbi:MAG TPA: NmrA family NAD(P)-binding protein [Candidatus Polarisedimenticolia bacterium]|jgi:uncharacterized protein YbjT (DUF2867 family)|nr:NmrA family NAD(P)-binding protein [Candidatus Polarisedimenticolia bacterium]